MEKILHPISGETGYFASEKEKILIDTVLKDFVLNQLFLTSHNVRGGVNE